MTEAIEYEQFDQTAEPNGVRAHPSAPRSLSRLSDIPMELSVEIGRTHMTVGETLELTRRLDRDARARRPASPSTCSSTAPPIARGEVVVVDEQYGLRVTEILDSQQDGARQGAEAARRRTRRPPTRSHRPCPTALPMPAAAAQG